MQNRAGAGSSKSATVAYKDQSWDPTMLLKDKNSFMLLSVVLLFVCILIIFFSCLGCCLVRGKNQLGKHINE